MPGHPQLLKPRVCDLGNYSFATIIMIAVRKKKAYLQLSGFVIQSSAVGTAVLRRALCWIS